MRQISKKNKKDSPDSAKDTDDDIKSIKMKEWPRSWRYGKDQNYLRFFNGSTWESGEQEVKVHTNSGPEDSGNSESVKYKMNMNILWKNNITVDIDIDWQKHIPSMKSWNPTTIIQRIMKNSNIKSWKARVHMWYNVVKWFIEMAKEKNIDLNYYDSTTWKYVEIDVDDKTGNIILNNSEEISSYAKSETIIFDYKKFLNTNTFDNPTYNWSLRNGLFNCLSHFNKTMNNVHDRYANATRKRFWHKNRSKNRFSFPRLNAIWGMNFDTSIQTKKWDINLKVERNKFTLSGWPIDWEISGKDLWKLLNKRIKKERIFDGVANDIMAWTYKAMIWKLREHSKIKKSSFWVKDDFTGKLYIIDSDWDFWVMTKRQESIEWNPIRWKKNIWQIHSLPLGMNKLSENETEWLLRNPEIMPILIKAMSKRVWFSNSVINFWKNVA